MDPRIVGDEAYREHQALAQFVLSPPLRVIKPSKKVVKAKATKRAEFVDQLTIQELSSGLIKDTEAEEAERGRLTIARLLEELRQ